MAVARRKEEAPAGAPEWMVTYGDMVTLLLTFFVLLLTFMEPKEKDLVQQLMQMLRQEFGYQGGVRFLPTDPIETPKNVPLQTVLQIPIYPHDQSPTQEEGLRAKQHKVTSIREPEFYQKGGKVLFAELSAEISEEQRARLKEYAARLRGMTFIIELRGHCSMRPVDGTPFRDHRDLSIQRARAVEKVLLEEGIDPRRIWIMGAGTSRPVTRDAYSPADREKNDLVEILQLDQSYDEYP
ncbi:MAG: hypothetical protein D6744_07005 [Planctomycetota bacterium]|nr:MAG: hypothetical protein D6744_07005 [Planctomycetota bacterium]